MKVVKGHCAEARVYLWHCLAVLRPGVEVPVFSEPAKFDGDLAGLTDDDLCLVVDEARRQLDRQLGDLERMRSRASALVTVGLAEIALLSGGARDMFHHGCGSAAAWALSTLLVVLGLAGAAAVLTVQAVFGRTDTALIADQSPPLLKPTAVAYAGLTGVGEETVRTRLTVLRDSVLLLVLGALVYACAWPLTR